MAFQRPTSAVNDTNVQPFARPAAVANTGSNYRKADAFVNIYMPTRDGGKTKLGAISLTADKVIQKQLLDFLADGGDDALAQIKERIVLDFKRADGGNGIELDLG